MAVCAVRPIRTIRCFSPNREHREAFSAEMSALLGVEVVPVAQPEDAIADADIIMCATNTLDNVFFERWIRPGIHLSAIKRPEIEMAALKRADRVVLHSHERHADARDREEPAPSPRRARTGAGHRWRISISTSSRRCRS